MFAGAKFWVAQRIPMRQFRLAQITEHGGLVVPLEKSADVLVWDHIKPDAPAGAISWTYIDQSVKNGALEDMNDHICGPPPGTVRAVGSDTSIRAGGHMRQPYTAADDRLCYKWGREGETKGAGVKGNELWKRLEMVNNRHTWQSWRSRWVKSLSHTEGPTGWEDVEIQAPAVKEEDSNVLRSTPGNARHRSPERRSPGEKRKIGAIKKIIGSAGNVSKNRTTSTTAISGLDGASSPPPGEQPLSDNELDGEAEAEEEPAIEQSLRNEASPMARVPVVPEPETTSEQTYYTPEAQLQSTNSQLESEPHPEPNALSQQTYFTNEDFLEVYENINDILSVNYIDFHDGWDAWAEADPMPRTKAEWENFFRLVVMPIHNKYKHLGSEGQKKVINWIRDYIDQHPFEKYSGWDLIEGESDAAHGVKTNRNHEDSTAEGGVEARRLHGQKRAREEEDESVEGSQESEELQTSQVVANPGIKRQRVEQIAQVQIEEVMETEEYQDVEEDISETIESSPGKKQLQAIDLTDPHDTSSNPGSSDNEDEHIPAQQRPAGNQEAQLRHERMEDAESEAIDSEEIADIALQHATTTAITMQTQAIVAAETQVHDFDIPEPEEGFAEDSEEEDDDEIDPQEQHDQDLLDQQLQLEAGHDDNDRIEADHVGEMEFKVEDDDTILAIPEPEGGFAETAPHEDSHLDNDDDAVSLAGSNVTHSTEDAGLEEYIAKGYSEQDVITACEATSGNRDLIELVLKSLRNGRGVPKDVRGVWSEEDDAHLQGSDARMIKRVEGKHGKGGEGGWRRRVEFLRDLLADSQE